MLERLVADVLVRILGSYVDGLNKESVSFGVWAGDLELRELRLRPDALAVLFETLGLDLPVTVTAGYVGLLRLEVPWKRLRSAPVRIVMNDVTVVASPVSDGDQAELQVREKRLKAARLSTDEVVRETKFSMRTGAGIQRSASDDCAGDESSTASLQRTSFASRLWKNAVTKIIDNIQVVVENVLVQYEDASSVHGRPYTASLAIDSLKACSTDANWRKMYLEDSSSPIVHKVVNLEGLVLNWEPGLENNALRQWILDASVKRTPGHWSGFVRSCNRHAILPLAGELRISIVKMRAVAEANESKDAAKQWITKRPRVEMDLHFPDIGVCLDDFNYHTLISSITYLSDIDRRVRPKDPRGRWYWALDRLLPRFKERRQALLQFNEAGLRKRREIREAYCTARNSVLSSRRKGIAEKADDLAIVERIEDELPYEDILLFRDISDQQLLDQAHEAGARTSTRIWSLFNPWRRGSPPATASTSKDFEATDPSIAPTSADRSFETVARLTSQGEDEKPELLDARQCDDAASVDRSQSNASSVSDTKITSGEPVKLSSQDSQQSQGIDGFITTDAETVSTRSPETIPSFRMAFLLERGAIRLSRGGYPDSPIPMSSLEFRELRLGVTITPGSGFLLEAVLGKFEAINLMKQVKVMYARAPWLTDPDINEEEQRRISTSSPDGDDVFDDSAGVNGQGQDEITGRATVVGGADEYPCATERSYPSEVSLALQKIRGDPESESRSSLSGYSAYHNQGKNGSSSSSLSALSDGGSTKMSFASLGEQSHEAETPLKYIAALRISTETAPGSGEGCSSGKRLAMDLAIGGMEVVLDGPGSAFIASAAFWTPRQTLPSIMHLLSRSAAPKLALLRMEIQEALLDHKSPMRMDLHIRAPRFIIAPVQEEKSLSIVVDLGTFAMETSTSEPTLVPIPPSSSVDSDGTPVAEVVNSCAIRYTDYRMTCSDLGIFVVSADSSRNSERLVKPFSLNLVLQVLHDTSYVEAMTIHLSHVDVAKVKLVMNLSSLKTTISHRAFRQVLAIAKGWTSSSIAPEANEVGANDSTGRLETELLDAEDANVIAPQKDIVSSPLISFEMQIDLDNLFLELQDASARRIVTVSSTGTVAKMRRRPGVIDFSYRVQSFTVTDGSRGATAPYRRLVYAGLDDTAKRKRASFASLSTQSDVVDEKGFIEVSYSSDLRTLEQAIDVRVLSLHLVCVRETYLALADFFYLVGNKPTGKDSLNDTIAPTGTLGESSTSVVEEDHENNSPERFDSQGEYSDPFNALGMTTKAAAQKLREKANRGMELSKQAFAQRGKLIVTACLDGLGVVLVTAEGAIASFELSDCTTRLEQMPRGAIRAYGQLGGFGIKDLTAAYAVHSNMLHYRRACSTDRNINGEDDEVDGWTLTIPENGDGDSWLSARLRNLNIVYLQRFVVILKKYFDVLRENLQPVLAIKGGIADVFDDDDSEDISALAPRESRLRLNCITEHINVIMPRHSQSPHEALRFVVRHSSITNEDEAAPGYRIGFQVSAEDVNGYVLYDASTDNAENPQPIDPCASTESLVPFTDNVYITSKLDLWRKRRVPQIVMNSEGIPVLKDGEDEREFDPAKWRPCIRVRVCAPVGLTANLCEAQYSILYFTFTENIIERPDIEFTDIVRGLKTPVLPPRRPIRPIMLSSHRMPPNYQVLFEVPSISSTIMHGGDPTDVSAKLIRTELRDIVGSFEYGVDFRMSVEVNGSLHSLVDIRPHAIRPNSTVIRSTLAHSGAQGHSSVLSTESVGLGNAGDRNSGAKSDDEGRSITLTWDRAFGYGANVMVVLSDLCIIVVPELFRDLGRLTGPGFPFLKSSAPAPFLRFNGRLLILTVSRPEIWLMAHQYAGDCRSLVLRGDVIAKVQWAAITGRNTVELAAHGLNINLSSSGPKGYYRTAAAITPSSASRTGNVDQTDIEVPLLYPSDVSLKHHGSGYDPPKSPGGQPTKAPGSELLVDAESLLLRVDVNDIPLILAVGSRLGRLRPSVLSIRPGQPGRFDEWIDKGEDGDARLFVVFALPHARLIFTDETAGHYIPIMELRFRNAIVRSNISYVTNAKLEFSIDLFNDEKGWWEPGVEPFSIDIAVSKGRSGSEAVQLRTQQTIDANITPTTISGATRVAKTLKHAIEDLIKNLKTDIHEELEAFGAGAPIADVVTTAQRPSVAAFCVKNDTGRSISLWLPYDSMRRTLKGNGEECEIAMPTEDLLWSAMTANFYNSSDRMEGNRDRHLSMQCLVSMTGYDPLSLSTTEVGSQIVYFFPEARAGTPLKNNQRRSRRHGVLTLVWTVYMRNGVPVGCLRSVFRLVNRTRTPFEVKIGQQAEAMYKSSSVSSATGLQGATGGDDGRIILKIGESWSVPVHAVERPICLRPAIFHPPDGDNSDTYEDIVVSSRSRKRVLYSYRWSDPLSRFSSLLGTGVKLEESSRSDDAHRTETIYTNIPVLSCRSAKHEQPFSCLVIPEVGSSPSGELLPPNGNSTQWLDVVLRAPFVISNGLPRPMSFAIANTSQVKAEDHGIIVKDWVEPLRDFHVHTAGTDPSPLSFGIGYDNSPAGIKSTGNKKTKSARSITSLHNGLNTLQVIPVNVEREGHFLAKMNRFTTNATLRFQLYADYWIRNRSSVDIMFRNAESNRDFSTKDIPECFLRRRSPGTQADKYVAFSGSWISFRTVAQNSDWKTLGQCLMDIDGYVPFSLNNKSLLAEVHPAKGEFVRTTIVTIRNAMWIENKTDVVLQWCQPAALNARGIALSSNVHTALPGECVPLHWDFEDKNKAVCLRRSEDNGSSDWIWSRPVRVDGKEGEFAAKMYRPKNHQQYIARIIVSRLSTGVGAIIIHREDRSTPPYRIINRCENRSIAFWQSGVPEKSPWLVRPGKTTRYSWDDPHAALRSRSVTIKIIETVPARKTGGVPRSASTSAIRPFQAEAVDNGSVENAGVYRQRHLREIHYPTFDLNIDIVRDEVDFKGAEKFKPALEISVRVDGPTKVVTFSNAPSSGEILVTQPKLATAKSLDVLTFEEFTSPVAGNKKEATLEESFPPVTKNLDVEVWIHSLGLSFVDESPAELAYLFVSGMHFRLDRFDGQQLIVCEVEDIQLDNQLVQCAWPVVLWSPPAHDRAPNMSSADDRRSMAGTRQPGARKPFFQLIVDGPFPQITNGIGTFRGIFVALQQLQVAADEDFVLRVWIFVQSIIAAAGGATQRNIEILGGNDGLEHGLRTEHVEENEVQSTRSTSWNRVYVKNLDLCPLKLTISFTSSRTSTAAARVGGFRSLIRTLVAVLGNVENAEFRFNALELRHVFDTTDHLRSLIAEFYISQGSNQKMNLLTSNSLIGNPSALFDSIAIGARDFFVEPAKAKGSADFIAGIGRGSSSLLTNTVGGIVGSLGGIPRAVAHGLETAVGDKEYLAERESIRGGRARAVASPAQGLYTGALSFGHGIASGAAGLFRDPYQGAVERGPSGFVKGLRKGVIGGVLKPITGALDLIAEPAAGFRSLMVSERNKHFAEPKRPPRAFLGAHRDRLALYDLRAALGASVLQAVLGPNNDAKRERLVAWVDFTPSSPGPPNDNVAQHAAFLWALMRRSTRSSSSGAGQLTDSRGIVQRVDKIRAGLITSRRVLVTSLNGNIFWEYPLMDVVDTQASIESKEYLSVGLRPMGYSSRDVVAPTWQRIHCGSAISRDAFNVALKKALTDFGLIRARQRAALLGLNMIEHRAKPRGDHADSQAVEMMDLSSPGKKSVGTSLACLDDYSETEMKALHSDASVDGRRGVFTKMNLPGRSADDFEDSNGSQRATSFGSLNAIILGAPMNQSQDSLSQRLVALMEAETRQSSSIVRSVRIFVVNRLDHELQLVRSTMESGEWAADVPQCISARSIAKLEAIESTNRVKDVSGSFVYRVNVVVNHDEEFANNGEIIALRFVNPMLASNAYAVNSPKNVLLTCFGGEKGDHAQTVVNIARNDGSAVLPASHSKIKVSMASEEPLLFGRSKVPPLITPQAKPPSVTQASAVDPNDPELIKKLSSLGFSNLDAHKALLLENGDLSKAYARLIENNPHMAFRS